MDVLPGLFCDLEVIEAPPTTLRSIKDKRIVVTTFYATFVDQDRVEVVRKVFELAESVLDFLFNSPQLLDDLFSTILHHLDHSLKHLCRISACTTVVDIIPGFSLLGQGMTPLPFAFFGQAEWNIQPRAQTFCEGGCLIHACYHLVFVHIFQHLAVLSGLCLQFGCFLLD